VNASTDVRDYPQEGYNSVDIAIGQDFKEHIFGEIVEEHQAQSQRGGHILYRDCCTAFDSFQCRQISDDDQCFR
jgi:hypothetical protein